MPPRPPTTAAPDPPTIAVEVSDLQSHLDVGPGSLAAIAARVLRREGVTRAAISIALVDDAAIHALNRRHLAHDWPTDVITFGLSAPGDAVLEAELVVSAEMAATTARASGADPASELILYVVHGLLHLCGFDDHSDDEVTAMRRREAEVLADLADHQTEIETETGPPARRGGRP